MTPDVNNLQHHRSIFVIYTVCKAVDVLIKQLNYWHVLTKRIFLRKTQCSAYTCNYNMSPYELECFLFVIKYIKIIVNFNVDTISISRLFDKN